MPFVQDWPERHEVCAPKMHLVGQDSSDPSTEPGGIAPVINPWAEVTGTASENNPSEVLRTSRPVLLVE
jgi:hypothetical protein